MNRRMDEQLQTGEVSISISLVYWYTYYFITSILLPSPASSYLPPTTIYYQQTEGLPHCTAARAGRPTGTRIVSR